MYTEDLDIEEDSAAAAEDQEESGMYEHFCFTADKGQSVVRIDKFLTNRMEHVSRSRVQSAADAGNILANGKPVKPSYKVKPLDVISVVLPYPPRIVEIIPENIPLDILYEDDDVIVLNKAAGMVVHPGHGNFSGTLVNALAYYLQDLPMFKSGGVRAGLVHRIDKNTSGILVAAKSDVAHNRLALQFFNHTIERLYVALAWGAPNPPEGTITGNIGRSIRDRIKMQVFSDGEQGKHAVTHYRVVENLGYVSLLECRLETGRTHQIRTHMEHIGHPLFNDERYGGSEILRGTTFTKYRQFVQNCFAALPRHALHAKVLGFTHPTTGKPMRFEAPLPHDMATVVEKWRRYGSASASC
ncbi:MAG: RluA family pseudouridine synthase [Prevotellaceae bacterium]|jgi:23S rRNA pseudouridine1911/1915/1917 synthase|nr:RluA family pseudouridine synthase [Prevotellaceae bacterium]